MSSGPLVSKSINSRVDDDPYSTLYVENLLGVRILGLFLGAERVEEYSGYSKKYLQSPLRGCEVAGRRH